MKKKKKLKAVNEHEKVNGNKNQETITRNMGEIKNSLHSFQSSGKQRFGWKTSTKS